MRLFKIHSEVQYKNRIMQCRNIICYSFPSTHSHFACKDPRARVQLHTRVVVGNRVRAETVAELELDHTGYVVCHNPSSYVEDTGEDAAVIVVEVYVEFARSVRVEAVTEDAAVVEAYSVAVGEVTVTVCCPAAVTVTVAAAGVTVTTSSSVVSCAVTVAVDVRVSVPAGTISVETIVNVVWSIGVCVMISMTVVVETGDAPAVGEGAPPSTGTTEYDALGISNGSG
jgi:hypothetical protein